MCCLRTDTFDLCQLNLKGAFEEMQIVSLILWNWESIFVNFEVMTWELRTISYCLPINVPIFPWHNSKLLPCDLITETASSPVYIGLSKPNSGGSLVTCALHCPFNYTYWCSVLLFSLFPILNEILWHLWIILFLS